MPPSEGEAAPPSRRGGDGRDARRRVWIEQPFLRTRRRKLGMLPTIYKQGGAGMNIRYTIVDSPLGRLLVAATTRGVCAVAMGRSDVALRRALALEYPGAAIGEGPRRAQRMDNGDPRASLRAPAAARSAARRAGDGVSVAGVERSRRDSPRRDALVRRGGFGDRPPDARHEPSPARAQPTPWRSRFPVTASCRPRRRRRLSLGDLPKKGAARR